MSLPVSYTYIHTYLHTYQPGGAVNYVAVTETLATSSELTAAGIAADNLVVSFYFALLFMLASEYAAGPEEPADEVCR